MILAALLFRIGSFTYVTKHRITDIDTATSDDDQYEVIFQAVGEPDWPFGYSHARIVLKHNGTVITKRKFDVANDGGDLHPDNWSVRWEEICVKVIINGEEQLDELYTYFFDGAVRYESLAVRELEAHEPVSPERILDEPTADFSELAVENENGESVFAIPIENLIECYNSVYRRAHDDIYLLPTGDDSWRCFDECSPRFGYEAIRYQFSEDWSVWPMPTVSVYAAESGEIYEVRMSFDDHGYQERLYAKFKDLSSCLLNMACPKLTREETDKIFCALYSSAYDNFFGDHHWYGDPERPSLSKLLQYNDIGFYCFYGSGNIEICMIPLTPLAMEVLYEEGTNVQSLHELIQQMNSS